MLPDVRFYGLLYCDSQNARHVNIHGRRNPTDVYLLCAANCNRSFRQLGAAFTLITNNRQLLMERSRQLGISNLEIIDHRFELAVPAGIPFFSAHFKLELYKEFARGGYGDQMALIDVDTMLLRQIPTSQHLSVYDISDQVFPRYGRETVLRDLQILSGENLRNGRWYGGEFVMGSARQFSELASLIEFCWPRYVQNLSTMHHLGDEMVLSAALNLYAKKNALTDYGEQGNVTRWWSSRTFNRQASFSDARSTALLHLPADKLFIAQFGGSKLPNSTELLTEYQRYVHRKLLMRSMLSALNPFRSLPVKYLPRLT